MEKPTQTTWTLVLVTVIIVLLAIIIFRYFFPILLAGGAFMFGYFFGYRSGKAKRTS